MRTLGLLSVLLASIAPNGIALAQTTSANGYTARVVVVNAEQLGDTASIRYVIQNGSDSKGSLESFGVMQPSQLVDASPRSRPWMFVGAIGGRGVAQWVALDSAQLAPGSSSDTMAYRAIGVIGFRKAWLEVFEPIPSEGEVIEAQAAGRTVGTPPIRVLTLGVVRAPTAGGLVEGLARLDSLSAASCGLGWISPAGACNSINQKIAAARSSSSRGDLSATRGQLSALVRELEAQRGQHVSETAFWLLKANASYLLGRL